MVVRKLGLPPDSVSTLPLTAVVMRPSHLFRISSYTVGEPYFGSTGNNRFDAPGCPGAPQFASCYFGTNLAVAIAETILRDRAPVHGHFHVSTATLNTKYVLRFSGRRLRLADLTGAHLKRLDGTADLAGTANFKVTQAWALAVHANSGCFDGFIYMSRHLNTDRAVVLFNRAAEKLTLKSHAALSGADGFAQAAELFGIVAS